MAAARAPVLRHLLSCQTRALRASNQRRWAQVHDVRFLATTQQPRNVLEKYRDKLDRKAREEGHADIDSLKAAYADKIQTLRKQADAVVPPSPPPSPEQPTSLSSSSSSSSPATSSSSFSSPPKPTPSKPPSPGSSGTKPLSSILDLAKAAALPVKELTAIWRLRHAAQANSLCAVIPRDTFAAMEAAARRHPQFVLPVPHPAQGAEMHFLQWTWDPASRSSTVLFTQLAEYKARGEFAAPHTTVTHYADLAESKGVVLMQGSVVEDRGVKVDDARWLVMCLQRFYGGWDGVGDEKAKERAEERRRLLEWFGKGDGRFSVEKLMEEAERMG
ncbi:ATP11 protein-domain-containing protein [Madurella fahalii]|uniref:ATP11 protein-domain-containing protein n=1 Tax=Madurella fahalii TaxID=1157608 RepID=A0ABQ0FY24_9PEZI